MMPLSIGPAESLGQVVIGLVGLVALVFVSRIVLNIAWKLLLFATALTTIAYALKTMVL